MVSGRKGGQGRSLSVLLTGWRGRPVTKLELFKPPRLRSGQEAESERHATWLELLYDLIFVAAVAQEA